MKILLDTNILVNAYNKSSPYQKSASNVIKKAMQGETEIQRFKEVTFHPS
jgi:predicted nucleic acid-binding protein